MEKYRSTRRLRPEHLTIPCDVEAPGVAATAAVLLKRAAVGLEAHDPAVVGTELFRTVGRGDVATAVAVRRVDPAVESPAQIVDDRVRIGDAETGVEFRSFVSDAVAVRVFEKPDVRRARGNDAGFVEHEAGDELE